MSASWRFRAVVYIIAAAIGLGLGHLAVRGQDSAVEVFQESKAGYFDSTDDWRDWFMYHMSSMFDAQAARIEALQEDVRELRDQNAWVLRILIGGGGVGVLGGGGAAWRKRRKRNG